MKSFVKRFKLRDPTWQAVGTIIGLIAVVISTVVAYDILRRSTPISNLTVTELYDFDPLAFGEAMEGRISLLVDGVETESVRVYYYSISNTGQNPIRPSDFVEPIQISVEEPWELLATETDWSSPPELEIKWNKVVTNTFEMVPTLLNAEDSLRVVFFLANPSDSEDPPNPKWTTRIVNVRALETESRKTASERSNLGIFYVCIEHYGWGVYWLAITSVILFVTALWLGVRYKRLVRLPFTQVVLITVIMMLSFASAEIFVDAWINHNTEQWRGIWIILLAQLLLFTFLAWPLLRRLKEYLSSIAAKNSTISDE